MEVKEDLFVYEHGVYSYSLPADYRPLVLYLPGNNGR